MVACGAVKWRFDGTPDGATAYNCTPCRRYGVLRAYDYEGEGIHVSGETTAYIRGDLLSCHFFGACGCIMYWRGSKLDDKGRRRIAVNLLWAEPAAVARIPIDLFDGLVTFEDLPCDGRCVADYRCLIAQTPTAEVDRRGSIPRNERDRYRQYDQSPAQAAYPTANINGPIAMTASGDRPPMLTCGK